MAKVFFSWLGETELQNLLEVGDGKKERSGIFKAIKEYGFEETYLFGNLSKMSKSLRGKGQGGYWCPYTAENFSKAREILQSESSGIVTLVPPLRLNSPTNLQEIYKATIEQVERSAPGKEVYYHYNSGTSAMTIVWVFLFTRFPGKFIETKFPSSAGKLIDELTIPFDISLEFISVKNTDSFFRNEFALTPEFKAILGRSKEFIEAKEKAQSFAVHDLHVVLEGESGTGKGEFAKAIHSASQRKNGPFEAVNCGAIPRDLVESELFGAEKGGFTGAVKGPGAFQRANNGTLFLDEIGDLHLDHQVKVLRAIPENNRPGEVRRVGGARPEPVNVRIIAATNKPLQEMMGKGLFRHDLFYRLAILCISLPPLRARQGDVGLLLDHFLGFWKERLKRPEKIISKKAKLFLIDYPWPGNVRQLMNAVKRMIIAGDCDSISLEEAMAAVKGAPAGIGVLDKPLSQCQEALDEVERHYIQRALAQCGNKISEAFQLLGFENRRTFENHMKKLNIKIP